MKRMVRRIVSLMLAALLLVSGVNGTGLCAVSAEATEPGLAVGQPWSAVWPEGVDGVSTGIKVEESGLYEMEYYAVTGMIGMLEIRDADGNYISDSYYSGGSSTAHHREDYYLSAGNTYTVYCRPYSEDGYYAGNMHVTMTKCPINDIVIGERYQTFEHARVNKVWVRFTSNEAGDYRWIFDQPKNTSVWLYEEDTGALTQYACRYKLYEDGEPYAVDGVVMTLKENTRYVMCISRTIGSLMLEKCEKDLRTIAIHEAVGTTQRMQSGKNGYVPNWFNYRVIYTDGTEEILTYAEIGQRGFVLPDVLFGGYRVDVLAQYDNQTTYYCGGTQPCVLEYNGEYSLGYVTLPAVTPKDCYGNGQKRALTPSGPYTKYISFELNMKHSGVYALYADNTSAISSLSYMVLDQYYNPVDYSEKLGGVPLAAGQCYKVHMKYKTSADVEVYFKKNAKALFPDTHPNGWYYDAMTYMVGRGAISGYANGKFGTQDRIQRQDFLVMLARFDGVDLSAYKNVKLPFKDVAKNSYYAAAVAWGYQNGIATGYSSSKFGVGDSITREQLVTFLYRYAYARLFDVSCTDEETQSVKSQYKDYTKVSAFAKEAVVWAIDRGVISGRNGTKIAPHGKAQRCEVAQMMYNAFLNDIF